MKINNLIILNILLILIIGCRNAISKNETDTIISTPNSYNLDVVSTTREVKNNDNISFVISCGSGCAMTYSENSIKRISSLLIEVIFKIDMYIDEELSDTYYETYIFTYDKFNKIEKIHLKNSTENILETFLPDSQESFKDVARKLSFQLD